tara:strand:+ start:116 stop:286 length:171 start_codon:yes stop_codon:yes gene_type:complete
MVCFCTKITNISSKLFSIELGTYTDRSRIEVGHSDSDEDDSGDPQRGSVEGDGMKL